MSKAIQLGSAALLVLSAACAGEEQTTTRPPIGELHQGVNLLDASDPSWGLSAAYVEDDRVVYLETRVGAMKPEVYRSAYPDDPANEMDMLIADRDGMVFFSMRGGDSYVDPSWEDEVALGQGSQPIDRQGREADFRLAQKAAIALGTSLPVGFADHALQFSNFAKMVPPADDPDMQQRALKITQAARPDAGYYNRTYSAYNWFETDLYHASTGCFAWICTAKHSGTIMWDYEGYYDSAGNWVAIGWVQAQVACNHGRCPSAMSYKCYSYAGFWQYNATINGETNVNTTSVSGGCLTPYNWNSGGYDHLCNDDAAYELWQGKKASKNTYVGAGAGDGYGFYWYNTGQFACNCNYTGCDDDWNSPNCP